MYLKQLMSQNYILGINFHSESCVCISHSQIIFRSTIMYIVLLGYPKGLVGSAFFKYDKMLFIY